MDTAISKQTRLLLWGASVLLLVSIFVPIWKIELSAPQYPEGLVMKISANGLGGNVDIINGLNHYIGMETLHSENFIEFTILPYIIGFYALMALLVSFGRNKKALYILFGAFVVFGIVAMVDFWKWEYNYGHNLNPDAPIVVPGMAYQPPLIGFKQLLNFGAYSIPDIGGWLFIGSGLFMLLAVLMESPLGARLLKKNALVALLPFVLFTAYACNSSSPEPIQLNHDHCDYCKMTISEGRLATELLTEKGRTYKFDDISCMLSFQKENPKPSVKSFFVNDYETEQGVIPAETAFFVHSQDINSPMGGNTGAFSSKEKAVSFALRAGEKVMSWQQVCGQQLVSDSGQH